MPKIITAHTGQPHITADDMSSLQQAIIGSNDYLLSDNPDDFTATILDTSTIQLPAGEVVVQGTHIRILSTDEVTIDSGQTGTNRIDVIAVCYTKTDEGIESAEVKVIKGEPSTTPTAADIIQSDIRNNGMYHEMPLFLVTVENVSIVSVDRVCETVQSLIADYNAIVQNTEDITTLKQSVKTNTDNITSVKSTATANANSINSLQTTVNSNTTNITEIKTNNLLWSGAYYMTETHNISLSQSVSAQTTGIVLVFSPYNAGALNQEFHCFFVPKYIVSKHSAKGHRFNMVGGLFTYFCSKYLYISNTNITGHSDNNKTDTGIVKYTNTRFVLRYVIGV